MELHSVVVYTQEWMKLCVDPNIGFIENLPGRPQTTAINIGFIKNLPGRPLTNCDNL